ncbi:MAG: phage holin family protein [Candidatus Levybacteria bacterium]|nr:phage holin family protein [Candidatus Levybacteria bacterium]
MKSLLRSAATNTASLYITAGVLPSLSVKGGILTFLIGGVALMLLTLVLKPILSVLSFPLNFITLGLFSVLTNTIILYILTLFITEITIHAFAFQGFAFAGFIIPKIYINTFFAYVITSAAISTIVGGIIWLMR